MSSQPQTMEQKTAEAIKRMSEELKPNSLKDFRFPHIRRDVVKYHQKAWDLQQEAVRKEIAKKYSLGEPSSGLKKYLEDMKEMVRRSKTPEEYREMLKRYFDELAKHHPPEALTDLNYPKQEDEDVCTITEEVLIGGDPKPKYSGGIEEALGSILDRVNDMVDERVQTLLPDLPGQLNELVMEAIDKLTDVATERVKEEINGIIEANLGRLGDIEDLLDGLPQRLRDLLPIPEILPEDQEDEDESEPMSDDLEEHIAERGLQREVAAAENYRPRYDNQGMYTRLNGVNLRVKINGREYGALSGINLDQVLEPGWFGSKKVISGEFFEVMFDQESVFKVGKKIRFIDMVWENDYGSSIRLRLRGVVPQEIKYDLTMDSETSEIVVKFKAKSARWYKGSDSWKA